MESSILKSSIILYIYSIAVSLDVYMYTYICIYIYITSDFFFTKYVKELFISVSIGFRNSYELYQ